MSLGRACLDTRIALDLTQEQVAQRVGVSRSYIAKVELGQADPSLDMVDRIGEALGLDLQLAFQPPIFPAGRRTQDAVHARCSAYADRRVRGLGWATAREVEIVHGRSHGWIDVLAFHRPTGTLMIIEIKTRLEDIGGLERQLTWYERSSWTAGRVLGWEPRRVISCCLALASDEVEQSVRAHRDLLALIFPLRAPELADVLVDPQSRRIGSRGFALIDPTSRRRDWLIRTMVDGRRSRAPYESYNHAMSRMGPSRS
jgi:transcriptional regulator with XRE-family HTH domain